MVNGSFRTHTPFTVKYDSNSIQISNSCSIFEILDDSEIRHWGFSQPINHLEDESYLIFTGVQSFAFCFTRRCVNIPVECLSKVSYVGVRYKHTILLDY